MMIDTYTSNFKSRSIMPYALAESGRPVAHAHVVGVWRDDVRLSLQCTRYALDLNTSCGTACRREAVAP